MKKDLGKSYAIWNKLLESLKASGGKQLGEPTPPKEGVVEALIQAPMSWFISLLLSKKAVIDENLLTKESLEATIPNYQRFDCWAAPHRIRYLKEVYNSIFKDEFMLMPLLGMAIRQDGTIAIWDGLHNIRSFLIYAHLYVEAIIEFRLQLKDSKYKNQDLTLYSELSSEEKLKFFGFQARSRILINSTPELEGRVYNSANSGTKTSGWDSQWSFDYAYLKIADDILRDCKCFKHHVFGYNANRKVSGIIATMIAFSDETESYKKIRSNDANVVITYLEKFNTTKPTKDHIATVYKFFDFVASVCDNGKVPQLAKSDTTNAFWPAFKLRKKYAPSSNYDKLFHKWFTEDYPDWAATEEADSARSNAQPGCGKGVDVIKFQGLVEKTFTNYLKKYLVPKEKKGSISTGKGTPKVYKK
jgi:hypothetical protein